MIIIHENKSATDSVKGRHTGNQDRYIIKC